MREHCTVWPSAEADAWPAGLQDASVTLLRERTRARSVASASESDLGEAGTPWVRGLRSACDLAPPTTRARVRQCGARLDRMWPGSHHERLEGSGYHRGSRGPALDRPPAFPAAADCTAQCARRRGTGGYGRAPQAEGSLARGGGGTARPEGSRPGLAAGATEWPKTRRASCMPD